LKSAETKGNQGQREISRLCISLYYVNKRQSDNIYIKNLKTLVTAGNKKIVIAAVNDEKLKCFEIKSPGNK